MPESTAVSTWRDTGQVFYLENTLKLSYESKSGVITIENLSLESLSSALQEIQALGSSSPLSQAVTADQVSAFEISVCAVTWQANGENMRIKAVPKAALLRSQRADFKKSQAVFRHAFLLEHDDLLSPSLAHNKSGVFIYNRISIDQFTQQIAQKNQLLTNKHRRMVSVKQDNFDTAFTQHETSKLEELIEPSMLNTIDNKNC